MALHAALFVYSSALHSALYTPQSTATPLALLYCCNLLLETTTKIPDLHCVFCFWIVYGSTGVSLLTAFYTV